VLIDLTGEFDEESDVEEDLQPSKLFILKENIKMSNPETLSGSLQVSSPTLYSSKEIRDLGHQILASKNSHDNFSNSHASSSPISLKMSPGLYSSTSSSKIRKGIRGLRHKDGDLGILCLDLNILYSL